jgi:sulfur carrier protein ThiS
VLFRSLPVDEGRVMRVKVRLFTTLVVYVPGAKPGISFEVELLSGASLSDLINQLNLPQSEAKIIFVNGRTQPLNYQLRDNDEVGVFPLIGGG